MVTKLIEEKHPRPFLILAKPLAYLKIPPNLITFSALLFGLITALMLIQHHLILAIVFGLISAYCDTVDGLVARLNNQRTSFGRLFDVTSDKIVEIMLGLGFAVIAPDFLIPGLLWGFLATTGGILVSVISNVGLSETSKKPFKLLDRGSRGLLGLLGLLLALFLGDLFITYFLIIVSLLSYLTVLSLFIQYYFLLKNKKA